METAASASTQATAGEGWIRAKLPPIPPEVRAKFVAHSVTAALDMKGPFMPSYGWKELRDELALPGAEPNLVGSRASNPDEFVAAGIAVLPSFFEEPPAPKTALVFFGCGTVAFCDLGRSNFEFMGFTPSVIDDGKVPYELPTHRLREGRRSGRAFLLDAQARLDAFEKEHPDKTPYARYALSFVAQTGYPNPGSPDADADVKALWHRPGTKDEWEWLALVHLRAFSGTLLAVLVLSTAKAGPLPFHAMKEFADEARDKFRYDLLCPRIERVHIFG